MAQLVAPFLKEDLLKRLEQNGYFKDGKMLDDQKNEDVRIAVAHYAGDRLGDDLEGILHRHLGNIPEIDVIKKELEEKKKVANEILNENYLATLSEMEVQNLIVKRCREPFATLLISDEN